jgi:hypothetical protein
MRCTVPSLAFLLCWMGAGLVQAQQPAFHDPLLDHFVGKWLLKGTIEDKEVVHDIDATWVLGHHYLHFHEISHEQDKGGLPLYEADVYVGWDPNLKSYACVWLDVYGGVSPMSIGNAKRSGNELPFVFHYPGSVFHTTFLYLPDRDTWKWKMDSEGKGGLVPFARLMMERVK